MAAPHMHVPAGLAPPTHSWARTLRGSAPSPAPNTWQRHPPPPLDTGSGPRRKSSGSARSVVIAPQLMHKRSVDMLGLANHARAWRRGEDAYVRTLLRRWHQSSRHAASIHQRGPLPEAKLAEAAQLAERFAWRAAARWWTAWRIDTATTLAQATLIELFLPHAIIRRRRESLQWLHTFTALERTRAELSLTLARRLAARRMLTALNVTRERAARSMLLMDLAETADQLHRPQAQMRREALQQWRQWLQRIKLAFGVVHLGVLACASTRLRRGIERWRQAAEAAAAVADSESLAARAFETRAMRQALAQLCSRRHPSAAALQQPLAAHGQSSPRWAIRCGSSQRAARERGRQLRCAEAMIALRRAANSSHGLGWATLHASTRSGPQRARAALRRWNCVACGGGTALDGGIARLVRVYAMQQRPCRRAAHPCDMLGVLREGRL